MGNNKSLSGLGLEFESGQNKCFCCGAHLTHISSACIFHKLCEECEKRSCISGFTTCCLAPISSKIHVKLKSIYNICFKCNIPLESQSCLLCKCKLCLECLGTVYFNRKKKCDDCCENFDRTKLIICSVCSKVNGRKYSIHHSCDESICVQCIKQGYGTLLPDDEAFCFNCPKCFNEFEKTELIQIYGLEKINQLFTLR